MLSLGTDGRELVELLWILCSDAVFDGETEEFLGTVEVEDLKHAIAVGFDGADAEVELACYFLVRLSLRDKPQDLLLSVRQELLVSIWVLTMLTFRI